MTPKRFKAVCTETGKPFRLDQNFKTHENFYKISLNPLSNQAICQSTGLTDIRGQEVYEGDVLCDLDGSLFAVIWSDKRAAWAIEYLSEDWDKSCQPLLCDALMINQEKVIGNRFMPQAELQARAEAVSNAQ